MTVGSRVRLRHSGLRCLTQAGISKMPIHRSQRLPHSRRRAWHMAIERARSACASVQQAIKLGYRHFDTAQMYGNEREVGEGVRASGIKREEIFVVTKVAPDNLAPRQLERSVKDSLGQLRLGRDRSSAAALAEQGRAAEGYDRGFVRRQEATGSRVISASRTSPSRCSMKRTSCPKSRLVCNQFECHPFLDQSKVIAACRKHGMAAVAYSPIARGSAKRDATLADDRQTARQKRSAGFAALSRAAGHRRDPAHQQGRAAGGEYRDL